MSPSEPDDTDDMACCPRFTWGDGTHDLNCGQADESSTASVVKLVTAKEREEAEWVQVQRDAHAEALEILDKARAMLATNQCTGLVVAFTFDDGFGRIIPLRAIGIDRLIGSIELAKHDLVLKTLVPDE